MGFKSSDFRKTMFVSNVKNKFISNYSRSADYEVVVEVQNLKIAKHCFYKDGPNVRVRQCRAGLAAWNQYD